MVTFHRQSVGDTVLIRRRKEPINWSIDEFIGEPIEVTLEFAHADPQNVTVNVKYGDITESLDLYQGDLVNIAKLVNIQDDIKLKLRGVLSATKVYFLYGAPLCYKFIWH